MLLKGDKMKTYIKSIFAIVVILMSLNSSLSAVQIDDVIIDDSYSDLSLNGAGMRSKWFLDLYIGALYLENKSSDANQIINSDKKMDIKLHIISSLISGEKLISATHEGFVKATNDNIKPIKTEIEQFLSVFKGEVKENDVYDFLYLPNEGVEVYKNNQYQTTIKSFDFKQALYKIWLGENPAQDSLKEAMLGLK